MFKKKREIIEPPKQNTTQKTTVTVVHSNTIDRLSVSAVIVDDSLTEINFKTNPTKPTEYIGMYDAKTFTGAQYNDLVSLVEWLKKELPDYTNEVHDSQQD